MMASTRLLISNQPGKQPNMKPSRAKILEDIKNQIILGKRLTALGIVLIGVAIYFFVQCEKYYATTVRAVGKIEQIETEQHKETVYYPVFSFVDSNGAKHLIHTHSNTSVSTTWNRFYSVGEMVGVLYSPDDPENARLNNIFAIWGWALSFGTIAFIFISIGVFLWYGGLHSEALSPDYKYAQSDE
jgi:hypothetical protein